MAETKARAARRQAPPAGQRALPAGPDGSGPAAGQIHVVQGSVVSAAEIQAEAEGIVLDDKVEFKGQSFRLADRIPAMTQLKFANAAARGISSEDPEGLAALYMFIRACIHRGSGGPKPGEPGHDPQAWDPGDWQRFEDHADATLADEDDLLGFVSECMEKIAARPTKQPSGSPSPELPTSASSRDGSSSPRVPDGIEDLVSIDELAARR